MPILKRAIYKQAVATLSYVFRCSKCNTTEVVENSNVENKCKSCGDIMQLVSSCFINKSDKINP